MPRRVSVRTFRVMSGSRRRGSAWRRGPATPLLVVHGVEDVYRAPELARELYERASGVKGSHRLDTKVHVDLYDTEPFIGQAADTTAEFLRGHL
jgi:uncharacterized protein